MTPLQYYEHQLNTHLIQHDPQQAEVIALLQQIYLDLNKKDAHKQSFLHQLLGSFKKTTPVHGLYLWGSVGVGKTYLMDIFYSCLSIKKMRLHFHRFMQKIHEELNALQGKPNPLDLVAKKIAAQAHVICFDEFFVNNITDAMILGGLFRALFKNGVCLVTSSNVKPDDLYKNGLQRERLLPAIQLIKENTTTFHMVSLHDYRMDHNAELGYYFTPDTHNADIHLAALFNELSQSQKITTHELILFDRPIKVIKRSTDVIWFNFIDIISVPRSQRDYIAISKTYKTVILSHLKQLKSRETNLAISFINLIDILYDAKIRLIVSAECPIEELYPNGELKFEFARTQSRLNEMRSPDYITKE